MQLPDNATVNVNIKRAYSDKATMICRSFIKSIHLARIRRLLTGKGDMAEEKRNRNALRSRKMLVEAFSELLAEEPFEKITVTDVTRRAGLNRGTFYAHFDSMQDLGQYLVDTIMGKLLKIIDAASDGDFVEHPESVIGLVHDHLMQEASILKTLAAIEQVDVFLRSMKEEAIERMLSSAAVDEDEQVAMRMEVAYVVGGLTDLYHGWLRGDFGDVPIDEVGAFAVARMRLCGIGA